jgi:hypothetical protein
VTTNHHDASHPKRAAPDRGARRPPEPLRPAPGRRRKMGLLEVAGRRRRFRRRLS